jgi:hypothetical protein
MTSSCVLRGIFNSGRVLVGFLASTRAIQAFTISIAVPAGPSSHFIRAVLLQNGQATKGQLA